MWINQTSRRLFQVVKNHTFQEKQFFFDFMSKVPASEIKQILLLIWIS